MAGSSEMAETATRPRQARTDRGLGDIAAEDDLVFVHWRATATHEGKHQMTKHVRDIEPTGEEGIVSGITLYRIEGGKFVERWSYHNLLEYALKAGTTGV